MEAITRLEQIDVEPQGHYWSFPEVLLTWGSALPYARLLRLDGGSFRWYLRAMKTQCTVVLWEGEVSPEALAYAQRQLAEIGIRRIKFLKQELDTSLLLPGGGKYTNWYSRSSWRDLPLSRNRREQFNRALRRFEFQPLSRSSPDDIYAALGILDDWVEKASKRQMIMGKTHYASCIRSHLQFENSHLFFCIDRRTARRVGLVGGYIHGDYSVVVNVKHDYTDNLTIHALWGFWMHYVHNENGVKLNCNGSTSDKIKRRMRMEPVRTYRPPNILQ